MNRDGMHATGMLQAKTCMSQKHAGNMHVCMRILNMYSPTCMFKYTHAYYRHTTCKCYILYSVYCHLGAKLYLVKSYEFL